MGRCHGAGLVGAWHRAGGGPGIGGLGAGLCLRFRGPWCRHRFEARQGASQGGITGVLGDLLSLVESLENEKRDVASEVLQRLPDINIAYANSCLTRALTWANNLGRESASV